MSVLQQQKLQADGKVISIGDFSYLLADNYDAAAHTGSSFVSVYGLLRKARKGAIKWDGLCYSTTTYNTAKRSDVIVFFDDHEFFDIFRHIIVDLCLHIYSTKQ